MIEPESFGQPLPARAWHVQYKSIDSAGRRYRDASAARLCPELRVTGVALGGIVADLEAT
ncbi:hypothetical protein [Nocardia sp. NPDC003354]